MNYKLEKNNNKKIVIILTSIIFCVLILVIGTTTAFFNQGENNSLEDIVNVDLTNTLKYTSGASTYMRGNLIPVVEEDVELFAMKNSENNFTDDDICRFEGELNACSLYEFTIKNTATVTQKINATLTPNPNTFANLYYMIYEGKQDSLTSDSKVVKLKTHIDSTNTSNMFEEVLLTSGQEKTYTVVFYIKSTDYDQTSTDLNKRFGAIISVNSITTGYNVSNSVGSTCYEMEKIVTGEYANTYRLTKFKGIDHDNKIADSDCGATKDKITGLYTVEIPSEIGDYQISSLGDQLFSAVNLSEARAITGTNEYLNIEKIIIKDGIEVIEDGYVDMQNMIFKGTFLGIGVNLATLTPNPSRTLEIILPSTLKHIGDAAFTTAALRKIDIPSSVETIGVNAFNTNTLLTELTFMEDEDGQSNLKTIGNNSFYKSGITSLTVPYNVETIGSYAFYENTSLSNIVFKEDSNGLSKLNNINTLVFYKTAITSIEIPKSVEIIGKQAFQSNSALTTVSFEENSVLKTIDELAFNNSALTSIEIPKSVETIGVNAFSTNLSLTAVTFEENSVLKTIGDSAFNSSALTSLEIPNSVEIIGNQAFYNNAITSLLLPNSLQSIGEQAFLYNKLTSVEISSSVQTIGKEAFAGNYLTTVTFKLDENNNSQLTTIGNSAFSGGGYSFSGGELRSNNLTYPVGKPLFIPSSVTYIGDYAFAPNSIEQIKYSGDYSNFGTDWKPINAVVIE